MSGTMPKVGFVLGSSFHPRELIEVARAIEAAGFDDVWSSEDYFLTGGVAGAAVMLGATARLTVGTGLLSSYARHPALIAMETATLASAYPGRFQLGIGAGGLEWLDQQGIRHPRPLSHVRGCVTTIRSLLAGEEVSGNHGGHEFHKVRLSFVPDHVPPTWIGATGPRMTALASEIADGLLLSVFSSPAFVRIQRQISSAGNAGPDWPINTFAFFVLADSVRLARLRARPVLAAHLAEIGDSAMTDAIGISQELRDLVAKGGEAELAARMPDSWIDQLCVCGDLDTCLEQISELGRAGSQEVGLVPIGTDTLPQDIERLGSALRAGGF